MTLKPLLILYEWGKHIIYHPNWNAFERKGSAIDNYTGATEVNWDCPWQTGFYGYPNYKPPVTPCILSINWPETENETKSLLEILIFQTG